MRVNHSVNDTKKQDREREQADRIRWILAAVDDYQRRPKGQEALEVLSVEQEQRL
jgi:hypothetical protein